jgi:hypothetical protein
MRYTFYTITRSGERTEWTHLSKTKAVQMNAYTSKHQPSNLSAWGWEESI